MRPNKTIVGIGTNPESPVAGSTFYRSYNVIVRNLKFSAAEDDSVNIGQQ